MRVISSLFVPLIVLFVVIYGVYKKKNVYDLFVLGAKEGFSMTISLFPPLLAMIFGINIFSSSGIIDSFFTFLKPFFIMINVPIEILPLAVMRPLSGSFGLAMLNDIFDLYGPDSYISNLASVIQGSSDTTLYIITLYFGSVGIKKIRYALWVGLLADLMAVILTIVLLPFFC